MSENGTAVPATAAHAHAPAPRSIAPGREIKPIDKAQFGQKAELAEKLKAILKDVPVLHERMKKAVTDFEEVTNRARAIVEEWERVNASTQAAPPPSPSPTV